MKNVFAKGYVSNWSEEVIMVKVIKNTDTVICLITG